MFQLISHYFDSSTFISRTVSVIDLLLAWFLVNLINEHMLLGPRSRIGRLWINCILLGDTLLESLEDYLMEWSWFLDLGKPECKICFIKYTTTGHQRPRVLKCGHTFCEGCVQIIARHRNYKAISCPFCTKLSIIPMKYWISLPFLASEAFPANQLVLEILNREIKSMLRCVGCRERYSKERVPRIHPACGHSVCEDCVDPKCQVCEPPVDQTLLQLILEKLKRRENWQFDVPINYTIRDLFER